MRSDIVFNALQTKNRFELCHEAFKAVRRLHKAKTRIADTTNDALARLAGINPPEAVITPRRDRLLTSRPSLLKFLLVLSSLALPRGRMPRDWHHAIAAD